MNPLASRVASAVSRAELAHRHGRLTAFNGLVIEASGPDAHLGELVRDLDRLVAADRLGVCARRVVVPSSHDCL